MDTTGEEQSKKLMAALAKKYKDNFLWREDNSEATKHQRD